MNEKKLTEPLKPNEIELRIGSISALKGFSLLAYKTARTDRNRLDDVVGCMNWQNKHYVDAHNNVICKIGIWDEDKKQWIWKEDTGAESFTEKEKGSYSDSFKRAGFRWGIGIELYDFPFIWVKWSKWKKNSSGKDIPDAYIGEWAVNYDGKSYKDGIFITDKNANIVWSNLKNQNAIKTQEHDKPPKTNIPQLQKDIHQLLVDMKNDAVEGFETTELIKSTIKKHLRVEKISDCKDEKKLQAFYDLIYGKATQSELEIMMARKGLNMDEREQLVQNVCGCPLSACFDEKLVELRKAIMKMEAKNE